MANRVDGRSAHLLGAASTAVLSGHDDVADWDDEELATGRRRDKNGYFSGKAPRLIPIQCWKELKRRQLFDTDSAFGQSVVNAANYLIAVADGSQEPQAGRMRACEIILDRFVGKPTERVQVDTRVELVDAPWAVALRNLIRSPGAISAIPVSSTDVTDDIVDAELVEPDLCLCGCGQPPRPGSLYFNGRHQAHAESKVMAAQAHPTPPPPDDDPILTDDDELTEEADDDDPVMWP